MKSEKNEGDVLIVLREKPLQLGVDPGIVQGVVEDVALPGDVVVEVDGCEAGELPDEQHGEGALHGDHAVWVGHVEAEGGEVGHLGKQL